MPLTEEEKEPADEAGRRDLAAAAAIALATAILLVALRPDLVLTDSLPVGTDLTGHVVIPWIDRSDPASILPGSWSTAMFGGFPVNQLYPWLPAALAAALSVILPLAVAFKITVVLPLIALPVAAWLASRWAALPSIVGAALAVGTIPYLFDTSCGLCGGNIASTLNGEYAFAWSVLFLVLALGAVDRLARTGRGVVAAAALVAATAFSHPVGTLWLVAGIAVILVSRRVWAAGPARIPVLVSAIAASLLAAFWWLPFILRREWMPLLGFEKRTDYLFWLLPATALWEVVLLGFAIVGFVAAARARWWFLVAIGSSALLGLILFVALGPGQLNNLRVLPLWYFGRFVLAAVGALVVVSRAGERLASTRIVRSARLVPVLCATGALLVVGTTWGWWGAVVPASEAGDGRGEILGQSVVIAGQSYLVNEVLAGSEVRDDAAELASVRALMSDVATRHGCGTVMWDAGEGGQIPFRTMNVMWQAPMWTDGCIAPADGLLLDSSSTTPAVLMTQSLVSRTQEVGAPGIPTFDYDLTLGVPRMAVLGVSYYLTHGGQPTQDAKANAGLARIATSGRWTVWQVRGSGAVSGPSFLPAVVEGVSTSGWDELTTSYFTSESYPAIPLAQQGPVGWPRATPGSPVPGIPAPSVPVSSSSRVANTVRWTAEQPGISWIHVPAYPGWSSTVGDVVRSSPSLLLAETPAGQHTVTKSRTPVDVIAILLAGLGLALLLGRAVLRRWPGDTA